MNVHDHGTQVSAAPIDAVHTRQGATVFAVLKAMRRPAIGIGWTLKHG